MASKTDKSVSIAILGGLVCAWMTSSIATRIWNQLEASTELTVLAMGVGFFLGAVPLYLGLRKRAQ
ncbi:MAG: hypothetical protein JKY37_30730 [Nannocystaceae bacterium]|nr:hypothetical protein [Nannocystaceae bacterium]